MKSRTTRMCFAAAMAATVATPTYAGMPVFDAFNFASNVVQNFQLAGIKHSLNNDDDGTVNYYTKNIDKHSEVIKNVSVDIKNTTKAIYDIDVNNYKIDNKFTWIINKSGDEIIPIPRELLQKMSAVHNGNADAYANNFKDASTYVGSAKPTVSEGILEGSRARKAANDMLVHAVEMEQVAIQGEGQALEELRVTTAKVQGHGQQLQVANALAGSQVNQLMKLRSSLLVGEAQRAAEAQVAADKDARAIAVSNRMRSGLAEAMRASEAARLAP